MVYKLPDLLYSYDSLEPYIDEETMHFHHDKHHQTYVDKLNQALEKYPDLQKKPVEELIKNINKIPEEIRIPVTRNVSQVFNHTFFFDILKKDTKPSGEILKSINKHFGSFEEFKKKFSESAISLFGSGWVWLVFDNGNLEILSTPNHENPLSQNKIPLVVIDVWEHAYYLKYKNKRADYVEAFFNVINWDKVNDCFKLCF